MINYQIIKKCLIGVLLVGSMPMVVYGGPDSARNIWDSNAQIPSGPRLEENSESDYVSVSELDDITEQQREELLNYIDSILGEGFMLDSHVRLCKERASDGNNDALAALFSIAEGKRVLDDHSMENKRLITSGYTEKQIYLKRREYLKSLGANNVSKTLLNFPKSMMFCKKLSEWEDENGVDN